MSNLSNSVSTTREPKVTGSRRDTKKIKFRYAASSLQDYSFKINQPWVNCSNQAGEVRFVDHGAQLRFESIHGKAGDIYKDFSDRENPDNADTERDPWAHLPLNTLPGFQASPVVHQRSSRVVEAGSDISASPFDDNATIETQSSQQSTTPQSQWGGIRNMSSPGYQLLPERDLSRLHISKQSPFSWIEAFDGSQCACLMLFFVEKLAPHGDIGNPGQDLALVIPLRARNCPPLLNAILVSSAMVLVSSAKYKTDDGVCRYRDVSLPSLNHQTVLRLYKTCIADLIQFSSGPTAANDENLLAAMVLLRYHEEMDIFYTGEDKELLLHSTKFLLYTQSKTIIETMRGDKDATCSISSTKFSPKITGEYFKSFRHKIFRVALRQELTAAYLTQRPVQYPLTLWELLDDIEADFEDDFIWADRHLLYCARLLDFCYRSNRLGEGIDMNLWQKLKSYNALWEKRMPTSFLPLLEEQPEREQGQILYRTWYLSPTHLSAVQFLELSRILLLVFDPTLPRHGVTALTAHQALSKDVRAIVIHLCSMAASYPELTPAFVQAAMAVAVFGEYFVSHDEQDTLLGFLSHLEGEFGWPTSRHAARLSQIWNDNKQTQG